MPWAGTHIDLAAHTIDYWSASLFGAPRRGLADRAPGFKVQDHGDRFESQLDLCGGSLVFPSRSEDFLIGLWRERLLSGSGWTAWLPEAERVKRMTDAERSLKSRL
jgi:hypothetical protein